MPDMWRTIVLIGRERGFATTPWENCWSVVRSLRGIAMSLEESLLHLRLGVAWRRDVCCSFERSLPSDSGRQLKQLRVFEDGREEVLVAILCRCFSKWFTRQLELVISLASIVAFRLDETVPRSRHVNKVG